MSSGNEHSIDVVTTMLKHPLVVAAVAALLGFGSSILYGWMQTPTDVAVLAAEMRSMQQELNRVNISMENMTKRIDAILLERGKNGR